VDIPGGYPRWIAPPPSKGDGAGSAPGSVTQPGAATSPSAAAPGFAAHSAATGLVARIGTNFLIMFARSFLRLPSLAARQINGSLLSAGPRAQGPGPGPTFPRGTSGRAGGLSSRRAGDTAPCHFHHGGPTHFPTELLRKMLRQNRACRGASAGPRPVFRPEGAAGRLLLRCSRSCLILLFISNMDIMTKIIRHYTDKTC
jgi:hypothetical protein